MHAFTGCMLRAFQRLPRASRAHRNCGFSMDFVRSQAHKTIEIATGLPR